MWIKRIAGLYIIFVGLIFLFERKFFGLANKNPYKYWENEHIAHFFYIYYKVIAPLLGVIIIVIGFAIIISTMRTKK